MTDRSRALEDLALVLETELQLVQELTRALMAQRDAVARDAIAEVETTIETIGRTLAALHDLKQHRANLLLDLTGVNTLPLEELEARIHAPPSPRLARVCQALRQNARRAAQEAAITQGVLRRVLQSGDHFLQELFAAAAPPAPGYAAEPRADLGARSGVILNRSA